VQLAAAAQPARRGSDNTKKPAVEMKVVKPGARNGKGGHKGQH